MIKLRTFLVLMLAFAAGPVWCVDAQSPSRPVRIAIVGLVHGHARLFMPSLLNRPDIQLAGIVEADRLLTDR